MIRGFIKLSSVEGLPMMIRLNEEAALTTYSYTFRKIRF